MTCTLNRISLAGLTVVVALSSTFARAQEAGGTLTAPAVPSSSPPSVIAPAPAAPAYQPVTQLQAQPYVPTYMPRRGRHVVGYREVTRSQTALWGTGLGIFLAGYVLDFAILTPIANGISDDRAGADEEDAWAWSLLPIAGPMIQLGIGAPHPAIPITTGLMQIGGLALFIYGLTTHETLRVPVHAGDPDDPNIPTIGFDVSPLPGGGQVNVRLTHF